jgi:fused signal recognition particle receptor
LNSLVKKPQDATGFFGRLREKFAGARQSLGRGVSDLLLGDRALDDDLLDELETVLLSADVGVETTQALLADIGARVKRKELRDTHAVYEALRQKLLELVRPCAQPLTLDAAKPPFVIMAVGVNGVGKTTSIAKIARRLKDSGRKVLLAAGDTFRAAAVEQLKTWGERLDVPVIAQESGADAAAVAHDALHAAQARGADVLIVDTAGRQHTHAGLMDELKKIRRVIQKIDAAAPHEVLLVLDAGTGQNALSQLKHFRDAVGVTGLVLTKLDGTAKGGILIAIARQFGLPIRFIGVGEGMDDLAEFSAEEFVNALLPAADTSSKIQDTR